MRTEIVPHPVIRQFLVKHCLAAGGYFRRSTAGILIQRIDYKTGQEKNNYRGNDDFSPVDS